MISTSLLLSVYFFFFNDAATTEIYTLSLHDALPISGNKDFLLRKKIERKFSELYPDKWLTLYSRVTFSHEPYAQALEKGKAQARIMDEVMKMENIHQNWDRPEVMNKILSLLT